MLNLFILSTYLFKFFPSLKFFCIKSEHGKSFKKNFTKSLHSEKRHRTLPKEPPKLFASIHPPSRPSIFKNSFVKYVFFSNLLLSDKKNLY